MHIDSLPAWTPDHTYRLDPDRVAERRTLRVIVLTALMMVVELVAGFWYGSMALLADGWHMGSHAAALGVTWFAYVFARRHATNRRFSFGTGKVGALGGFASAVALGIVALLLGAESTRRLFSEISIQFDQAILVAVVGLVVNLVSAWMLGARHHHGRAHAHAPSDEHRGHAHDHNLRAAYLHVLADALTSVLAIGALLAGKFLGLIWLDPAMGIVGMVLIARWSIGLLRDTGRQLLDYSPDAAEGEKLRKVLEAHRDTRVCDLHVWTLAPGQRAALVSLVTHEPEAPEFYKAMIEEAGDYAHVTVEVNPCEDKPCPHAHAS
jgi:cation diffusion facilitator family transporter